MQKIALKLNKINGKILQEYEFYKSLKGIETLETEILQQNFQKAYEFYKSLKGIETKYTPQWKYGSNTLVRIL